MQLKIILLDSSNTKSDRVSVFDASLQSVKREENVKCMMTKVQSSNILDVMEARLPLQNKKKN